MLKKNAVFCPCPVSKSSFLDVRLYCHYTTELYVFISQPVTSEVPEENTDSGGHRRRSIR